MQNLNNNKSAQKTKPILLIVDDMSINIQMLSDLLKDDYKIKIAKNGQMALDIVRGDEPIDLILLDVIMPEMDGYEVCKALKNDSKTHNIPVIFVTSNDSLENEEYGLNLGAVDYIRKPFHPMIVKIRVRNHINLKLKSDMLEELSMLDGLTHIPNRRYFDERYEEDYKESMREKKSFAVMMIDIDCFKLYNDNYGHGKGDDTLVRVANILKNNLKRPSDIVARYGGEEFVVIAKDISQEGAHKVAQRLVDAVAALKIPHIYSKKGDVVTISVGVAYRNNNDTPSKEQLLQKADEAMYKAKNSGKNKYILVEG
ncbi:MAG: diguanylate cyclase [Sulfurimonadaceae bacterium]|jgi:diguanylate cyclase (GGDEF)-like protein|nr:diguanylate cyclase [Sulfurimonadaceae bacterium]